MKVAVITRNKNQFDYFLKEIYPDDREMFVFIDSMDKAIGIRFDAVIRTGEFFKLSFNNKIYQFIKSRLN